MADLAVRAERELREIVARYAAAEGEVVRSFFAAPHSQEEYLDAVLRQAGREIHSAYQMTRALRMLDELESSVSRDALYDQMERITDEVKHYSILADLAEELAGRKLGREEALQPAAAARERRARLQQAPDRGIRLGARSAVDQAGRGWWWRLVHRSHPPRRGRVSGEVRPGHET
ncbi:MAG: hypothetical protein HW416_3498, partial [Chloroflexi bacterium]|nr:hypothetical protein [Chloroflexota bacterium]